MRPNLGAKPSIRQTKQVYKTRINKTKVHCLLNWSTDNTIGGTNKDIIARKERPNCKPNQQKMIFMYVAFIGTWIKLLNWVSKWINSSDVTFEVFYMD